MKQAKTVFAGMSPYKSPRDLAGQAGGTAKKDKHVVFVGMSGGVDSSVAALLLSNSTKAKKLRKKAGLPAGRQGYDVVGIFMRCYNVDGCAERDAEDARRAAERIGISFYVWDFEEEYKRRVVDYMIEGYKTGLTPNPDVMCNREVKFGLFLKKALTMGADYVATGHYVRKCVVGSGAVNRKNYKLQTTNYKLFAAKDASKDQSYFLWTLTQRELQHCLFPIGDYLKPKVREIARRAELPTAEKKDSQGICFLGQVAIADFLSAYLPKKKGAILTADGKVVGEHEGAHLLTVGQRHVGAAIRTGKGGDTRPHYVVSKNVRTNTVVVAEGRDNPLLFKREVELSDVNFLDSGSLPVAGMPVLARVRYRQPLTSARLYALHTTHCALVFDKPQQFVAEGQSAVWYSTEKGNLPAGRQVLGGGVISRSL